jgi:acetyl-CoA acyltransferase
MKAMSAFIAGSDVEETTKMLVSFYEEEQKRLKESGGVAKPHSPFMDIYTLLARKHMEKYGTTQRHLAVIAAKAHQNSTLNPLAQYTFPMTVEEVLADKEVAYPLTRAMCAPIGDGAAAAVICSEEYMKRRGLTRQVKILASVLASGNRYGACTVTERCAAKAYEMAGLGPKDVDVAEVHDATSFGELHQVEQLGFCEIGKGGEFAESGATALTGKIPVNPSGGLIARGHPVGASGIAQMHELSMHLRGEAGKRQVKGARIALAENGGGFLGDGEAAMTIHILEKC